MAAEGSILGAPAVGGLDRAAEPPLLELEGGPPLPDGAPLGALPRPSPPRGAPPRIAPRGPPRGIPRPLWKVGQVGNCDQQNKRLENQISTASNIHVSCVSNFLHGLSEKVYFVHI